MLTAYRCFVTEPAIYFRNQFESEIGLVKMIDIEFQCTSARLHVLMYMDSNATEGTPDLSSAYTDCHL
jgi:hypothetical protein